MLIGLLEAVESVWSGWWTRSYACSQHDKQCSLPFKCLVVGYGEIRLFSNSLLDFMCVLGCVVRCFVKSLGLSMELRSVTAMILVC